MKIRNLAFCGVMASILGMGGAYAADATIIASKAYVDARDNTKQDTANIVTGTWANSTADHNSTTKYPSMNTLGSAIQAGATDAINALNLSTDGQTGVIKTVKQTNGLVAVTSGTVNTNDITDSAVTNGKIADSAVTAAKLATNAVETDKIKNDAVTNAKIANESVSMPKTNFIVKQGSSNVDWSNANAESDNADEKALGIANNAGDRYVPTVAAVETRIKKATDAISSGAETGNVVTSSNTDYITKVSAIQAGIAKQGDSTANWNTVTSGTAGTSSHLLDAQAAKDNYIPTVAAVEKRVTDETSSMTDSTASATYSSTNGITIATANGAGNQGKFATSAAVASTANALKDAIEATNTTVAGLDLTAAQNTGSGQAVVEVTQTDGQVAAARGILDYNKAMNAKLSEINTNGGDGSQGCTKRSPCTLTMVMDNGNPVYEWTNMETDGLDGVL